MVRLLKMADAEAEMRELRIENDNSYRRELAALFKTIRAQAISNAEYFQDGSSQNSERFHASFRRLYEHLDRGIEPGVECILSIAHKFDLDGSTPANGYRSMVKIVHKCCIKVLQLIRYIDTNRTSFLFRSGHYSRELEAFVTTLGQLRACLYYLERLLTYSYDGVLFPDEEKLSPEDYQTAERLMMEVETLCQETFYGRCLAFQYCESMARPLTTIVVAMASFADTHLQSSSMLKVASTILGSGKYIMDQELRAQQVVNVTRNGDIKFLTDFWSVTELDIVHQIPIYVCPQVTVDRVISIQPDMFELPKANGDGTAKITPPCAHSGPSPVHTRLISFKLREGQERWLPKAPSEKSLPPSPCLVLHCHGGGFVAQSSATHQVYLRHWAKELACPILSVDYSLAPEFPFPRQLEEIFFAYCWALRNHKLLGWTGERVCFAGDSAGGNLVVATAMRALAMGVRAPDGIMSVYGVMLVRYCPSASRIMALMDPLLSIGVMANCLAAYSGMAQSTLVGVPYYHGPNHRASTTPTPVTPMDVISPLATSSPQQTKPITRHKSTTSGDSGFDDLVNSDTISGPMRRDRSADSGTTLGSVRRVVSDDSDLDGVKTDDTSQTEDPTRRLESGNSSEMETSWNDSVAMTTESEVCPSLGVRRHSTALVSQTYDDTSSGPTPSNGCDAAIPSRVEFHLEPNDNNSPLNNSTDGLLPSSELNEVDPEQGIIENSRVAEGADLSNSSQKPQRSRMWLDFGGFFKGRHKERALARSPSSPANLSSGVIRKTPDDQKNASVKARLCRLRLCRSVRFTLWLVTGDLFSHYLPCLQLHYRSPFAYRGQDMIDGLMTPPTYAQIRHFAQSPVIQFRHMPIVKNPYMSPYLAQDHLLANMPPVYFLACHLDPMLDDSIMMAQRLRSLGREVHVDVLDDLPHGFLNFVLLSHEAKRGSDLIVQRLRHMLQLDEIDWNQFDVISDSDVEEAGEAERGNVKVGHGGEGDGCQSPEGAPAKLI